eukprot:Nk52_evm10s279 gene=Nk52_evmTU10s279
MSLKFNWPVFTEAQYDLAREELTKALNRGDKHPSIVDKIHVQDMNFGSCPPDVKILEVCDLSEGGFRGIFQIVYEGDAYIVLRTKAQANPVNPQKPKSALSKHGILAANKPLIVPLKIKISQLSLNGIAVLDVSKSHGVTLAFKNDPFRSVLVNTTFDDQPSVRRHLQTIIEEQLKDLFNNGIPRMVHEHSQKSQLKKTNLAKPTTAMGNFDDSGVGGEGDYEQRRGAGAGGGSLHRSYSEDFSVAASERLSGKFYTRREQDHHVEESDAEGRKKKKNRHSTGHYYHNYPHQHFRHHSHHHARGGMGSRRGGKEAGEGRAEWDQWAAERGDYSEEGGNRRRVVEPKSSKPHDYGVEAEKTKGAYVAGGDGDGRRTYNKNEKRSSAASSSYGGGFFGVSGSEGFGKGSQGSLYRTDSSLSDLARASRGGDDRAGGRSSNSSYNGSESGGGSLRRRPPLKKSPSTNLPKLPSFPGTSGVADADVNNRLSPSNNTLTAHMATLNISHATLSPYAGIEKVNITHSTQPVLPGSVGDKSRSRRRSSNKSFPGGKGALAESPGYRGEDMENSLLLSPKSTTNSSGISPIRSVRSGSNASDQQQPNSAQAAVFSKNADPPPSAASTSSAFPLSGQSTAVLPHDSEDRRRKPRYNSASY